jgi:hypothetical protein
MNDVAALKTLGFAMMIGGVVFLLLSVAGSLLGVEIDEAAAGLALLAGGVGFDRARRALERLQREHGELRAKSH